jgi:hypothetical protein
MLRLTGHDSQGPGAALNEGFELLVSPVRKLVRLTTPAPRPQAPGASPDRQPVLPAICAWSLLFLPSSPSRACTPRSVARSAINSRLLTRSPRRRVRAAMGDVETERLRGFEIDHKLEFGRRLSRQCRTLRGT